MELVLSHGVNLAHGVVKGQTEHAHEEVDGVARSGQRSRCIGILDDETRKCGRGKIARLSFNKLEAALVAPGTH
jgi:hypothetical protein